MKVYGVYEEGDTKHNSNNPEFVVMANSWREARHKFDRSGHNRLSQAGMIYSYYTGRVDKDTIVIK